MTAFCDEVCGTCDKCFQARQELHVLETALEALTPEDIDSLYVRDEDDPRTFALDHRGTP
jgi:hypothetical protein